MKLYIRYSNKIEIRICMFQNWGLILDQPKPRYLHLYRKPLFIYKKKKKKWKEKKIVLVRSDQGPRWYFGFTKVSWWVAWQRWVASPHGNERLFIRLAICRTTATKTGFSRWMNEEDTRAAIVHRFRPPRSIAKTVTNPTCFSLNNPVTFPGVLIRRMKRCAKGLKDKTVWFSVCVIRVCCNCNGYRTRAKRWSLKWKFCSRCVDVATFNESAATLESKKMIENLYKRRNIKESIYPWNRNLSNLS